MLSKEKWQWMHALTDKVFDINQGKQYGANIFAGKYGISVNVIKNATDAPVFYRLITDRATQEEFDSILLKLDAFVEKQEEENGDWDKDFDEMTDAGLADGD